MTPLSLEERIVLPAGPAEAWAVLTDWERQASWMPDVARVRVLGEERGLGARLEVRTRVLGLPLVTDRITVTAWEPPSRLAVRHEGLVIGLGEWRLDPVPGVGTRLTWVERLRMPPPVLGSVALRLYGPIQRLMLRRSIRNLRRLVERSR